MSFNIEGSLYELVARGNKDVYFIDDAKTAKNLFDTRYGPTPPHLHEIRRLPPLNTADFGRSFEFQIEMAGDVFIDPTLLIDLPSWLPPTQTSLNPQSVVTDDALDSLCSRRFIYSRIISCYRNSVEMPCGRPAAVVDLLTPPF